MEVWSCICSILSSVLAQHPSDSLCTRSRRLDHRSQQHAASADRSQGQSVGQGHTARSPFAGPQQTSHQTLAAVAEGGSGSEASPSGSPAERDAGAESAHAADPLQPQIIDELLLRQGCSQTLGGLASLASSPEGVRLTHARIGKLGKHQVRFTRPHPSHEASL